MESKRPDLSNLNTTELKELIIEAEATIKTRTAEDLRKAHEAVVAAAQKFGFSLDEVLVGAKIEKRVVKAPPKFRNPDNADETWSGRGRQPTWYRAALDAGKTEDDLRISPE